MFQTLIPGTSNHNYNVTSKMDAKNTLGLQSILLKVSVI